MHKLIQNILLCSSIFIVFNSYGNYQDLQADIITSPTWSANSSLSFIVRIINESQEVNTSINGSYLIHAESAVLEIDTISIKKGVGSLTTLVIASTNFIISIDGFSGEKMVTVNDQIPILETGGEILNNTTWTAEQIYHITDDLVIPENISLQIEEGTQIFLGEKVNITTAGHLKINGTKSNPVLFNSIDKIKPWGGIQLSNITDTIFIDYCFFCNGGDNENYIFGHSDSQPVIMINNSFINLRNCFFIDNPGKAVGGINSLIKIENCIISRCDTGGEYHHCTTNISDSWFIDIPGNNNANIDDNDALYFYEVYQDIQVSSKIINCYFVTGMDDGVDHNGADLIIENCWIEDYFHEGIAASNYNQVVVYNTLIKDCEQGIEAGYGNPLVKADHCVFVENEVGIRFGDSYNWGCQGQMEIINSISYDNTDNIKNYDLLSQGPVEGAIDISYCITNDSEYNNYPGCLEGIPDFDANYFLLPGSVGIGLANDGGNLGLINPSMGIKLSTIKTELSIMPNPFKKNLLLSVYPYENHDIEVYIFDLVGLIRYEKSFNQLSSENSELIINVPYLEPGSYFLVVSSNGKRIGTKKLIKVD